MKKVLGVAASAALAVISGQAYAESVEIPQVPAGAISVDESAETSIKANNNQDTGDYQSQILNDPNLNDRARAEEVMKKNYDGGLEEGIGGNINAAKGNTAVIVQHGKSNNSSIIQKGNNNYASQTQTGNHNDLRVEQTGKNNRSVENQTGNYNHKVKIQNGKTSEETTIEQTTEPKE